MTLRLRYRLWKLRALMWLLRRLRKGRGPRFGKHLVALAGAAGAAVCALSPVLS